MIKIIFGIDEMQRSKELFHNIYEDEQKGIYRSLYIIIPEQLSLQENLSYLNYIKSKYGISATKVQIISFRRLSERLGASFGIKGESNLDEVARLLIIRQLLAKMDRENNLTIPLNYSSFNTLSNIKSTIAEFEQFNVDYNNILSVIDDSELSESSKNKIVFLANLYKEYSLEKERRGLFSSILEQLPSLLLKNKVLDNTVFAFDGFNGFTFTQLKFIESLISNNLKIYFTLCLDKGFLGDRKSLLRNNSLFYSGLRTFNQIMQITTNLGAEYDIKLLNKEEGNRLKGFLHRKGIKKAKYISIPSQIKEVEYVAHLIYDKIQKENYRYKDFNIIAPNEDYMNLMQSALNRFGVMSYCDRTPTIVKSVVCEHILSLLNMISQDFSYESVFRYLKSPVLAGDSEDLYYISNSDLEAVENEYIRVNFRGYKNFSGILCISPLLPAIDKAVKGIKVCKSLHDYLSVIYSYMRDIRLVDRLNIINNKLNSLNYSNEQLSNKRSYILALKAFERLEELLGDNMVDLPELIDILKNIWKEYKLTTIPASADMVQISDARRSRGKISKDLFVLGFVEGLAPTYSTMSGIILDHERESLTENNITLGDLNDESMAISKFELLNTMTSATENIYITAPDYLIDGTATVKPSLYYELLSNLFLSTEIEWDKEPIIGNSRQSLIALGEYLGIKKVNEDKAKKEKQDCVNNLPKLEKNIAELEAILNKDYKAIISVLKGDIVELKNTRLSEELVKSLYPEDKLYSVTELESYANCPYSHFLRYGLRLRERKIYTPDKRDYGNILHGALFDIWKNYVSNNKISWTDRDKLLQESDTILQNAILKNVSNRLDNNEAIFIKRRLEQVFKRHIDNISYQYSQSLLREAFAEQEFNILTPKKNKLHGYIDRVDMLSAKEIKNRGIILPENIDTSKELGIVVDYKTNTKEINYTKLYKGIELQLPIYMKYCEEELNMTALGMYYYHLIDPFIDIKKQDEEIELLRKKTLSLEGLSAEELPLLQLIDRNIDVGEKSISINHIKINKNGGKHSKNDHVAPVGLLNSIGEYSLKQADIHIENIRAGEKKVAPSYIKDGKGYLPCEYCLFKGSCGIYNRPDLQVGIDEIKREEALLKIEGVLNENRVIT